MLQLFINYISSTRITGYETKMKKFIPGLELCERFFFSAVKPIMKEKFPKIAYAAARLDYNSDVLGFDTTMSMDSGWGPKLSMYILSCNNWGGKREIFKQSLFIIVPST